MSGLKGNPMMHDFVHFLLPKSECIYNLIFFRQVKFMKDSGIYYSLGALLYIAADNTNIIDDIIFEKFNIPFSLAFSFDMTSNDAEADKAENVLIKTFDKLFVTK